MRPRMRRLSLREAAWLCGLFLLGCRPSSTANLSPTPKEDPERYERAVQDHAELIQRNQEAERKAMGRKGRMTSED